MNLNKENLNQISGNNVEIPLQQIFTLPEKVLQFGTGVLLRALPDYFIDKANKQGIFNGRIVVVKSTEGDSSAFNKQNNLYTISVRGNENETVIEENIINASISRVLSAKSDWQKILACAANAELKLIISNTTEVGIQLVEENILEGTPTSFPGKLLAFLYERFKIYRSTSDSGFIIIPTELVTDNGIKLKTIVNQLAQFNKLPLEFINWLNNHNTFCNSLVDRIVPGKPNKQELENIENELGYTDELLCMSEVFRLWAIEANEDVKNILSFTQVDAGVVITPDITLYKELKLRLLNGTHTFNCGLAFLSGFTITREAITHPTFSQFAKKLMHNEIAKAIPFKINENVKTDFANKVFERFCNLFINHKWQSITTHYTSKMKMRNVPLIQIYFAKYNKVPMCMATSFAAYILYTKPLKIEGNKYYGLLNDVPYEIVDDNASYFYELWQNNNIENIVSTVLANKSFWEVDLTTLPKFEETVLVQLQSMITNGVLETVENLVTKKEVLYES
jgi:tagaturonate reductase